MSQWSANINVMLKAVRTAGRGLMRDFNEVDKLQISRKSAGDFTIRADIYAESTISEILLEARPNYGFVAPNTGEVAGADPTRRWLFTPLDGQENFLHGLPHWALSLALEYKGEIVAAVIFNPVLEELFVAEKGAGAWLNDKRLRVSGRREMPNLAVVSTIPSGKRDDLPTTLKDFARIAPAVSTVRSLGCTSLELAYVAAGRVDALWDREQDAWSLAAGGLLVKEAGGLAEAIEPKQNPLEHGSIIATNAEVFTNFAKLVRNT